MSEFVQEAGKQILLKNYIRWNSWFYMIYQACDLEKYVDFYTKNQPDLKKDMLLVNK